MHNLVTSLLYRELSAIFTMSVTILVSDRAAGLCLPTDEALDGMTP